MSASGRVSLCGAGGRSRRFLFFTTADEKDADRSQHGENTWLYLLRSGKTYWFRDEQAHNYLYVLKQANYLDTSPSIEWVGLKLKLVWSGHLTLACSWSDVSMLIWKMKEYFIRQHNKDFPPSSIISYFYCTSTVRGLYWTLVSAECRSSSYRSELRGPRHLLECTCSAAAAYPVLSCFLFISQQWDKLCCDTCQHPTDFSFHCFCITAILLWVCCQVHSALFICIAGVCVCAFGFLVGGSHELLHVSWLIDSSIPVTCFIT